MRIFGLLLLSLCATCAATAQQYRINLKKEKLKNTWFVGEIIDVRVDKNSIGTVERSFANPQTPVNFKEPFKQELLSFFNANASDGAVQAPLIVKVYKVGISELTFKGKQIAKAEVHIEFIVKKENLYYQLLDPRVIVESFVIESAVHHERNLAMAFQKCFEQLAMVDVNEKIQNSVPIKADLLRVNDTEVENDSVISKLELPIFHQPLQKGLYTDFKSFKNNVTTLDRDFYVEKEPIGLKGFEGYYVGILRYSDTHKRIKDTWGFYDGESLYVQFNQKFYPLIRDGNLFKFYAPKAVVQPNMGALIFYNGITGGGLIGGALISAAVIAGKDRPVKHLYKVNLLTEQIDLASENNGLDSPKETSGAAITIYRVEKSQLETPIQVFTSDSLCATLLPNSQTRLKLYLPLQPVVLCIGGGKEQCITVTPKLGKITFVSVSNTEKKGAVIKEVKEEVGTFSRHEIEFKQQKKNKALTTDE